MVAVSTGAITVALILSDFSYRLEYRDYLAIAERHSMQKVAH